MNLTKSENIIANSFGICNLLKASAISFIGVIYENKTIDVIDEIVGSLRHNKKV